MKNLLLIAFLSAFCLSLNAQEFEIPDTIALNNEADYKKHETNVLNAINWVQATPIGEQKNKRKEVNAFLFKWMSGSPNVTIELSQDLVPFMDCSDCLVSFMNGWTKFSLENNYSKNKLDCALAATNHTIEFYTKNKNELGKIDSIEKLSKRKSKGKLKAYIKSKLPTK